MKEQLYTIPMNDAVNAGDECPFCFIERNVEQDLLDYCLGSCSSYMEADMRDLTDRAGFCRMHFRKMFKYGNTLGNGWILKTHYKQMLREFDEKSKNFHPGKGASIFGFLKKTGSNSEDADNAPSGNSISKWIREKEHSCYICQEFDKMYARYIDTFFYLWKDDTFHSKITSGNGFCLSHYADLCDAADKKLSGRDLEGFYEETIPLMRGNLDRISEDVSWLVEKFDYRNKDADWKNSKDAIQRGMQKLKGGYPADPDYAMKK